MSNPASDVTAASTPHKAASMGQQQQLAPLVLDQPGSMASGSMSIPQQQRSHSHVQEDDDPSSPSHLWSDVELAAAMAAFTWPEEDGSSGGDHGGGSSSVMLPPREPLMTNPSVSSSSSIWGVNANQQPGGSSGAGAAWPVTHHSGSLGDRTSSLANGVSLPQQLANGIMGAQPGGNVLDRSASSSSGIWGQTAAGAGQQAWGVPRGEGSVNGPGSLPGSGPGSLADGGPLRVANTFGPSFREFASTQSQQVGLCPFSGGPYP